MTRVLHVFGRPVRPVAAGLFGLSVILLVWNFLPDTGDHDQLTFVVAGAASVSAIFLFLGWFRQSQWLTMSGFIAVCWMSLVRFFFELLIHGWDIEDAYQSLMIAVIAYGSFVLEHNDPHSDRFDVGRVNRNAPDAG